MMKRLLSLILGILMALSVVSCERSTTDDSLDAFVNNNAPTTLLEN